MARLATGVNEEGDVIFGIIREWLPAILDPKDVEGQSLEDCAAEIVETLQLRRDAPVDQLPAFIEDHLRRQ